jgi:gas vesicle protein
MPWLAVDRQPRPNQGDSEMNRINDSVLTFCLGAAAGAAVALLVAPQSGQETRQALRRGADDLVVRGGETVEHVARRAREVSEKVGGAVEGVRDVARRPGVVVKEAAQAAKAAYHREMQKDTDKPGSPLST